MDGNNKGITEFVIFIIICVVICAFITDVDYIILIALGSLLLIAFSIYYFNKKSKSKGSHSLDAVNVKTRNDKSVFEHEKDKTVNTYNNAIPNDSYINTRNNLIKKYNLFNKSIYNKEFSPQIRDRGEKYFIDNRINNYKNEGNTYFCTIKGNSLYKVSLTLLENKIIDAKCNCPYFKEGYNCKHLYALLYKIKCSENRKILLEEIHKKIKNVEELMNFGKEFINKNVDIFPSSIYDSYSNMVNNIAKQLSIITEECTKSILEDKLIDYLVFVLNIRSKVEFENKKIENSVDDYEDMDDYDFNENKFDIWDGLALGYLISNTINKDNLKSKREDIDEDKFYDYAEDTMDMYDLTDEQKEDIYNGDYDLDDFDDDD